MKIFIGGLNFMIKNKKIISGSFILLILIFAFTFNIYGEFEVSRPAGDSRNQYPEYTLGAVSIRDVTEWQKEFQNGTQTDATFDTFFKERAVPILQTVEADSFLYYHGISVDAHWGTEEEFTQWGPAMMEYYAVFEEDGQYDYILSASLPEVNPTGPYIKSCVSGRFSRLDVSEEEFQTFLEEERAWKKQVSEKCQYVTTILDESEYLNCYCEYGELYINLVNEKKSTLLEELGFYCVLTDYSRKQAYQDIKNLWKKRDELGILKIGLDLYGANLYVYGRYEEEVFMGMLNESEIEIPIHYYFWDIWKPEYFMDDQLPYDPDFAIKLEKHVGNDMENPAWFVEELYFKYLASAWYYVDHAQIEEEKWESLQLALVQMKAAYPEYSCQNIYYHIVGDCDASAYMDFDSELLEFVTTLPAYVEDENIIIEIEFGDPQRIELKRMLRQYRKMFPELSYDKIYETYVKDMEENIQISKAEKLYWYLWKKYSGEVKTVDIKIMEVKEEAPVDKVTDNRSVYLVMAGFGIIIAFFVIIRKKKK